MKVSGLSLSVNKISNGLGVRMDADLRELIHGSLYY